jgi:nucleoid-associated protein YgaU
MVAALQAPPRVRTDGRRAPARVVPLRLVPDYERPRRALREADLRPERVVIVHRQPRPRATRSKRAVYMRRRLIAASLGLGIVLTAAHAGLALGGSTTTPGRSPHPHFVSVVVQRGDTLWSIAERLAPSSNTANQVDKWAEQLGTSDVRAGQGLQLEVS